MRRILLILCACCAVLLTPGCKDKMADAKSAAKSLYAYDPAKAVHRKFSGEKAFAQVKAQVEFGPRSLQRLRDRMLRLASVQVRHFLPPPGQFGRSDLHIMALVDDIIDFPAEGVERGDGAPLRRGQEEKAVVEARATAGCFLLAVFVGGHARSRDRYEVVILP